MEQNKIQIYDNQPIRTAWDEENEEWSFAVVDVIGVLTEQQTAKAASTYWAVMKNRLKKEGADQLLTNCKQLKLKSADGKRYNTDVANTEQKRKPPGQHEHAGTGAEYACRGYYNSTDKSAES